MLGLLGVHPRSVVGHREDGAVPLGFHRDPHRGARRGVGPDVGQQVVDDLSEADGVPHHLDGPRGVERHRPVGTDGRCGVDGLGAQCHQVYRPSFHGPALVQAGQQQQVGHQVLHAARLGADPTHDPLEIGLLLRGPPTEQLGVGGDGGDGGAELVGGVGHEPAESCLGGPQPPLRGQAGAESRLDPGQHDIQRAGQTPDLGLVVLARDPLGQVAGGDGLGCGLHVPKGAEPDADQPPPADQGDEKGGPGDGELDEEQVVERTVDVGQGLSDDELVTVAEHGGLHPKGRSAGVRGRCRETGGLDPALVRQTGEGDGDGGGVLLAVDVGGTLLAVDHGSGAGTDPHGLFLDGIGGQAAVAVPVAVGTAATATVAISVTVSPGTPGPAPGCPYPFGAPPFELEGGRTVPAGRRGRPEAVGRCPGAG